MSDTDDATTPVRQRGGPGGEGPLVVVSNRLPVVVREGSDGRLDIEPGAGGLVTAMTPVLKERGGTWIGWPGLDDRDREEEVRALLPRVSEQAGYDLEPVFLTPRDLENFYYGFANQVLWPLFHDLQSLLNYDPRFWTGYERVNRKYARVVAESASEDAYVWIHDYHLMLAARELRELGYGGRVGFFLHTPFPSPDVFVNLPWRVEILRAMLQFDLVGLQVERDRRNFLACVERLLGEEVLDTGTGVSVVESREGSTRVAAFPISIDFGNFAERAASEDVEERMRRIRDDFSAEKLVLGVDRLDYTKGIPYRLNAFEKALEEDPDLHGRVTLIQIVVPSREGIAQYSDLKVEIEQQVGAINGRFAGAGWMPVHYLYRSVPQDELLASYRAADVGFVTPLKDGMNLVSKEYCASTVDEEGVLILSEFAGSAAQLQDGALLVNPYDVEGMAMALWRALRMDDGERAGRMRDMREGIRVHDIFWWVDRFFRAAGGEDVDPMVELPTERPLVVV